MVESVMYWLKHISGKDGIFNCIANQNGFTLQDMVSYDRKHNEMNGEHNQDGPEYNYSWNCGAEGRPEESDHGPQEPADAECIFLLLLAQERRAFLREMSLAIPRRGIIMYTVRITRWDGRTGAGLRRTRSCMIL